MVKTSFSTFLVLLLSRNSRNGFGVSSSGIWWIGRAQHPGPVPSFQVGVEVFNVGGVVDSWGPGS